MHKGRLISVSPLAKTRIVGMRAAILSDLYHFFVNHSWFYLFGFVVALYLGCNAVFAELYLLGDDCLANARPGSFVDAFFFSVQTLATIGYGYVYPKTVYANLLVTGESLLGLVGFAMVTGLAFAKFSRPRSRVIFSRVAVVARHDGMATLMFRMANERINNIAEATINVVFVRPGKTAEGRPFTRLLDLTLTRHRSPMFTLTWTALHPLDEASPIKNETQESLLASRAFLVCSLTGYDASIGQTVHARHTYTADQIVWNARLVDILRPTEQGGQVADYKNFHKFEAEPTA